MKDITEIRFQARVKADTRLAKFIKGYGTRNQLVNDAIRFYFEHMNDDPADSNKAGELTLTEADKFQLFEDFEKYLNWRKYQDYLHSAGTSPVYPSPQKGVPNEAVQPNYLRGRDEFRARPDYPTGSKPDAGQAVAPQQPFEPVKPAVTKQTVAQEVPNMQAEVKPKVDAVTPQADSADKGEDEAVEPTPQQKQILANILNGNTTNI